MCQNSRSDVPLRQSCDTVVNSFGHKLLSLCKQHDLLVVNGRLDNGCFSCYKVVRNTAGSSLVDYLITDLLNFQYINEFQVLDLNEYSDHCAIRYSFKYKTCKDSLLTTETDKEETTKIVWDMDKNELFHDELLNQTHVFDCIISDIEKNEININDCINRMTNAMYDICKKCFGKKVNLNNQSSNRRNKSPWYNENCKIAKTEFLKRKKSFKKNPSNENKINFLKSRNHFAYIKRKEKRKYFIKEGLRLSELSKKSSSKFWKTIRKYNQKI